MFNVADMDTDEVVGAVRAACPVDGPDAVIEVCGVPAVVPEGLHMLRKGGRYIIAGIVFPNADVTLDTNLILNKLLTIQGVHDYHPRHLIEALDFVYRNLGVFPFKEIVNGRFGLDDLDMAFKQAAERQVLRAAIVP